MAHSSPEGIILSKGSRLESFELSINKEKVISIKQEPRTYTEEEVMQMLMYGIHEARMQDDKLEYQILNETLEQFKKEKGL